MDVSFFARGFVIGLAIAAPVGPIGVLCIRRTLVEGRKMGLVTGLGAASADAIYGAAAAFGLTAVSSALVGQQDLIRLFGGAFLLYLGFRTLIAPVAAMGLAKPRSNVLVAYGSTLALTLTNPSTILSFVAVFAGLGLADKPGDQSSAAITVLGVFIGSAVWWLFLSNAVGFFRRFLTEARFRWINRGSGTVLMAFGLIALVSIV
jgi:threonine/homoserine/homoserine lactone efflux protein